MAGRSKKPLKLSVREAGSATVVQVCGSVGMNEADKLRRMLEDVVANKPPVIVLDLSGMDFISSVGLGVIVTGYLRTRRYEGQLRLASPQPAVRELLETTRLTKLFPLFPSVEEAANPGNS